MRRGSTTLLIALFAASLGVGAAWWLGQSVAPPPEDPIRASDPGQADADSGEPAAQQPGGTLALAPRSWLQIEPVGRYAPPAAVRVQVRRGEAVVAAVASIVGGAGQEWPAADLRGGEALVRIAAEGRVLHRRVHLEPGASSAEVQLGIAAPLRGTVVDPDGKPVVGARVWVGGDPGEEVETDASGSFEAEVASGIGVPVVVRAKGMAWTHRFVDVPPAGATAAFVLSPECTLAAQIVGDERVLRGTVVRVTPAGASYSTETLQYPFFAQALLAEFAVDDKGRVELHGLPRGGAIGVSAIGPLVPGTTPLVVELVRTSASVAIPAAGGAACRGIAVDEQGAPMAGAFVWCWAEDRAPAPRAADRWLLARASDATLAACATTGADGAFELHLPPGQAHVLAADAPDRATLTRALERRPGALLRCPLPHAAVGPVQLRVPPPARGLPWPLRIDPGDQQFRVVAADREFVHPLPQPMLARLRWRTAAPGGWSEPRLAEDVLLHGNVVLPRELLPR